MVSRDDGSNLSFAVTKPTKLLRQWSGKSKPGIAHICTMDRTSGGYGVKVVGMVGVWCECGVDVVSVVGMGYLLSSLCTPVSVCVGAVSVSARARVCVCVCVSVCGGVSVSVGAVWFHRRCAVMVSVGDSRRTACLFVCFAEVAIFHFPLCCSP